MEYLKGQMVGTRHRAMQNQRDPVRKEEMRERNARLHAERQRAETELAAALISEVVDRDEYLNAARLVFQAKGGNPRVAARHNTGPSVGPAEIEQNLIWAALDSASLLLSAPGLLKLGRTFATNAAKSVTDDAAKALAPKRGVTQHDVPIGPQLPARSEMLPGELAVGRFDDLPGFVGDNVAGHHMPSSKFIREKLGMEHADGIAMNMQHFSPSNVGRHPLTRTFGSRGRNSALMDETFREALGRDIWDARRIYMDNDLYTPEVRRALQDVIRQWRDLRPDLF